ncbi:MAG: HEAT repeat domain-containing protein [Elusimicrobia bacterium]|nr:HEAT repeat domain-containing protein [Elusimicrobiota bacterium]
MHAALAAVFLTTLASASPAFIPLPGYGSPSARAEDFPPNAKLLGEVEDPLEALTGDDADLRDSVISAPSPAWLMAGLRASNPADRLAAVHSAAIPRHVSAIPPLAAVMLRLDEKSDIRAAAATALGRIGDAVAAPSLGEALNDPAPDVRYAAALALGRLPADGAATRLTRAMRTDPSWWVRYAAVLALGRTKKGFVIGALEECLRVEPKWQIRMLAVHSLQDVGGPRAAEAVGPALRDKDSGVRTAAALALGDIGGDDQLQYLSAALKAESDPSARSAQSAAFRRILSKP